MTIPYIFHVTCFGCKLIRIIPILIICILLYYIYNYNYFSLNVIVKKKENFTSKMHKIYKR